jgi:hypothetical protein
MVELGGIVTQTCLGIAHAIHLFAHGGGAYVHGGSRVENKQFVVTIA